MGKLSEDEKEMDDIQVQNHYSQIDNAAGGAVGLLMGGPEPEWVEQDDKLKLSDAEEDEKVSLLSTAPVTVGGVGANEDQKVSSVRSGKGTHEPVPSGSVIKRADDMEMIESGSADSSDDIIDDDFTIMSRKSTRELRNARMKVQGFFERATATCFSMS